MHLYGIQMVILMKFKVAQGVLFLWNTIKTLLTTSVIK